MPRRPYDMYPEGVDTEEARARFDEIMDNLPGLMAQKHQLDMVYIRPTGVVLPARLKPEVEGESTLMGMPVAWSENETWGLIVSIPSVKKDSNAL